MILSKFSAVYYLYLLIKFGAEEGIIKMAKKSVIFVNIVKNLLIGELKYDSFRTFTSCLPLSTFPSCYLLYGNTGKYRMVTFSTCRVI